MTPAEKRAYAHETHLMAVANHERAEALWDLVFPPWRWVRWFKEWRAIEAGIKETKRRMKVLSG